MCQNDNKKEKKGVLPAAPNVQEIVRCLRMISFLCRVLTSCTFRPSDLNSKGSQKAWLRMAEKEIHWEPLSKKRKLPTYAKRITVAFSIIHHSVFPPHASICWSILSSCPNTFPNFSICRWYNLVDRSVKNLRNFSPWLGRCTKDKVISLKEVKYCSIYLRKMYFTLQIFQKANIASNKMACRNELCSGSVGHALFTWCDYDVCCCAC